MINKILRKLLPSGLYGRLKLFLKNVKKFLRFRLSLSYYYAVYCTTRKVHADFILYESSAGAGMTCNPYSIFKEFMKDPLFDQYKHIWVIQTKEEMKLLKKEYKQNKNIKFILYNTIKYVKYLAITKYIFQNTSFSSYFAKREEQVYINTWHSITVKTLGFDVPNGPVQVKNMLRNLMQSDYIISANKFTTKIFRDSYKLDGLYTGKIIEEGHPRNDSLVKTNRDYILNKLQQRGVTIDPTKKIILYAPTWRGSTVSSVVNDVDSYCDFVQNVSGQIDGTQYQILIKPHPFVYKKLSLKEKNSGTFISSSIDTNELLSIVDILISDYSSIYFDFLNTNRPVLFYIPDLESYTNERGLYFTLDELPGPIADTANQIGTMINNIDDVCVKYKDIYDNTKSWACEYDDGNVSKKIIDIIFHNKTTYNIHSDFITDKKKILIYGGGFLTNGVTTSLISLLNMIDYNKYDISVCSFEQSKSDTIPNLLKLNHNVRVFFRCGTHPATTREFMNIEYLKKHGFLTKKSKRKYPTLLLKRDFIRCFGNAKFDYAIDFSGYGLFFPLLFLQAEGAKRIIWQHNDLQNDLGNNEKYNLGHTKFNSLKLNALISIYRYFDVIVSSSKELMEINREKLSTPETRLKFSYVTNTLNYKRILTLANEDNIITYKGNDYIRISQNDETTHLTNITLYQYNSCKVDEAGGKPIRFVTVGRLSPEKNHTNLLYAFKQLHELYKNIELIIIGNGTLRKDLVNLVNELGIQDAVTFTGNLDNPFGLMKHCDCFIFPSKYEGQGLVVLEARLLKLPIIVSDYDVVQSVCVPNGQLIVGKEKTDLYNGMVAFMEGKVTNNYIFNPKDYNAKAYSEFEKLFE